MLLRLLDARDGVADGLGIHSNIRALVVPAGVTSIGPYAFLNFRALASVKLPAGLMSIGAVAFSDTPALVSE